MKSKFLTTGILIAITLIIVAFAMKNNFAITMLNEISEEGGELILATTKPALIAVLLLSFFGVCETFYVLRTRLTATPAVCPIGDHVSCSVVLESKYNKFLGIHNDLLGFIYYATVSALSILLYFNLGPTAIFRLILITAVSFGAVFSAYLTYLQARVIKAWCFWCLTSAVTTWLLFIIIYTRAILQ